MPADDAAPLTDIAAARARAAAATVAGVPAGKLAAQEALAEVPPTNPGRQARPGAGRRRHRPQFGGLVAVDVDHVEIQRGAITAWWDPTEPARRPSSTC